MPDFVPPNAPTAVPGAIAGRTSTNRAAAEVVSLLEFVDPADNNLITPALNRAVAWMVTNGARQLICPPPPNGTSAWLWDVQPQNQIGLGSTEGPALKLLSSLPHFALKGIPGQSIQTPTSNRIEMICQDGCPDVILEDLVFDNSTVQGVSGTGVLSGQAKPSNQTRYSGVAGQGNQANAWFRQYRGASAIVRRVSQKGFNLSEFFGNIDDKTVLEGTLIWDTHSADTTCFGVLFHNGISFEAYNCKAANIQNDVDINNAAYAGHFGYGTDRSRAATRSMKAINTTAINCSSDVWKWRNQLEALIDGLQIYNGGGGATIENTVGPVISNMEAVMTGTAPAGPSTGGLALLSLNDVANAVVTNAFLDISAAPSSLQPNAILMRLSLGGTGLNAGHSFENIQIRGAGLAPNNPPIKLQQQSGHVFKDVTYINTSTTKTNVGLLGLYGSSNIQLIDPRIISAAGSSDNVFLYMSSYTDPSSNNVFTCSGNLVRYSAAQAITGTLGGTNNSGYVDKDGTSSGTSIVDREAGVLLSSLPLAKLATAPTTALGAGKANLFFLPGTTAGTAALWSMAGTSPTPLKIADNIGGGF